MSAASARILIIDDEDAVRSVLGRVLSREGYEVALARSGRDGLRLFRDQGADLVVTDVFMAEGDGVELIGSIRQFDPDVKILVISGGGGHGHGEVLEDAAALGADAALPKPFTRDDVLGAVATLLEGV